MTQLLNNIILSPDYSDDNTTELEKWFTAHNIDATKLNVNTWRICNGVINYIMFYPTKFKLMFQDKGRNYIITSRKEETILALINGDIAYKKEGE